MIGEYMFLELLSGVCMGIVFGFLLEKSRVFEPGMIIGQLQLRNFTMLKVFLSAIASSMVVFATFFALGFDRLNWKFTVYTADIIGGVLLGIGIALAGGCPGTIFAQIGVGYKDSIATACGALCGALTFILVQPWLKPMLDGYPHEKLTFDTIFGLSVPATALLFLVGIIFVLMALELYRPWRRDIGDDYDGLV